MSELSKRWPAGVGAMGLAIGGAFLAATAVPDTALAQGADQYPCSEIRWIVPFSPGGGVDVTVRIVADKLSSALGDIPVVIENRGGASGSVGAQLAKAAAPNGCTVMSNSTSHVVNQVVSPEAGYDLLEDFEPVIHLLSQPYVIAVNSQIGVETLADLIELAKTERLRLATSGTAGAQSVAGGLLQEMAGIEFVEVAYSGGGEQVSDMLANRVQVLFTVVGGVVGGFEATGEVRYVGVTSLEPLEIRHDIPPVADTLPGYEINANYGVFAPSGTPPELVERLHAEIQAILLSDEVSTSLANQGRTVANRSSAEFGQLIADELQFYRDMLL